MHNAYLGDGTRGTSYLYPDLKRHDPLLREGPCMGGADGSDSDAYDVALGDDSRHSRDQAVADPQAALERASGARVGFKVDQCADDLETFDLQVGLEHVMESASNVNNYQADDECEGYDVCFLGFDDC